MVSLCSACSIFVTSQEVRKAELLFSKFDCQAVTRQDIQNSVLGKYHYSSLMSDKANVEKYIRAYKDGDKLFQIPLDQVVQQKLSNYQETCKSLGGVLVK